MEGQSSQARDTPTPAVAINESGVGFLLLSSDDSASFISSESIKSNIGSDAEEHTSESHETSSSNSCIKELQLNHVYVAIPMISPVAMAPQPGMAAAILVAASVMATLMWRHHG